uniref:Uncharacterized protein n=1 Tax=Amphimedon queenslandica TaxID=400682 RepID=A0A1X7VNS5_AMPQE
TRNILINIFIIIIIWYSINCRSTSP